MADGRIKQSPFPCDSEEPQFGARPWAVKVRFSLPPRGFEARPLEQDKYLIRYRTSGMGCLGALWAVWIPGWTAGCVYFTGMALYHSDHALLLFMLPCWILALATAVGAVWFFCAATCFIFGPHELVVERRL